MTDIPPELMQKFSTDAMGGHPNITPKDASTLILLDRSGSEPKVLMGKRHDRHVFMPGAYVFPGGRVDPIDRSNIRTLDVRILCSVAGFSGHISTFVIFQI